MRDFTFIEKHLQQNALRADLRYGEMGKAGAEKVFATAAKIWFSPASRTNCGLLQKALKGAPRFRKSGAALKKAGQVHDISLTLFSSFANPSHSRMLPSR
jgi:hypothetical protein